VAEPTPGLIRDLTGASLLIHEHSRGCWRQASINRGVHPTRRSVLPKGSRLSHGLPVYRSSHLPLEQTERFPYNMEKVPLIYNITLWVSNHSSDTKKEIIMQDNPSPGHRANQGNRSSDRRILLRTASPCSSVAQLREGETAVQSIGRQVTPCSSTYRSAPSPPRGGERVRNEFGRLDVLVNKRGYLEYRKAAQPIRRGIRRLSPPEQRLHR